jgi:hypothetical protein
MELQTLQKRKEFLSYFFISTQDKPPALKGEVRRFEHHIFEDPQ